MLQSAGMHYFGPGFEHLCCPTPLQLALCFQKMSTTGNARKTAGPQNPAYSLVQHLAVSEQHHVIKELHYLWRRLHQSRRARHTLALILSLCICRKAGWLTVPFLHTSLGPESPIHGQYLIH